MIIKNKNQLATTELRKHALEIIEAGIARVLPAAIMESAVNFEPLHRAIRVCGDTYPIPRGRLFVIGGGKASCLMAATLEKLLGPQNITGGLVICKETPPQLDRIKTIQAGHPIPDQRGVDGVERILQLKDRYGINQDDLVVCLISGGGSALMPSPVEGLSLEDKKKLTGLLLSSGAEIHEINSVRKHLSKTKGGRLGNYFSPATVISLILSDVIGNDLSTIASGPTVPDPSTYEEAYSVLKKYNLVSKAPGAAVDILKRGCQGLLEETPKVLNNCHNYIVGDNKLALEAMSRKAAELGYRPKIITAELQGDTTGVAFATAHQIIKTPVPDYDAFILGGETTIQLPESPGKGGRNQHYAAASLMAMLSYPNQWAMASAGTDGSDYLPDVAGAIVDNNSVSKIKASKIDVGDFLKRCDSNTLMHKLDDALIETGDTGTNVGDILVYLLR